MQQRGVGEPGQGVNARPVPVDEARTRTGRKAWADAMERRIPAPRAARETPREWAGALPLHPCLHAAGRGPGSGVDRAGERGCPRGSAPLRRARLRAWVRVRDREAPSRRRGPGSPAGSLRSPQPPRPGPAGPAAARLAPAPRPPAHTGKVNSRMAANEVL